MGRGRAGAGPRPLLLLLLRWTKGDEVATALRAGGSVDAGVGALKLVEVVLGSPRVRLPEAGRYGAVLPTSGAEVLPRGLRREGRQGAGTQVEGRCPRSSSRDGDRLRGARGACG